ncbi:hypothetical protein ACX3YD_15520 [Pseudomonas fluorescens group sp. PF-1]
MSIYYRFYIKTQSPRRVEQLILHTLGGDGWLEPYGNGYLRPIQIALVPGEAHVVLPNRDSYGSPITSDADTGWWCQTIECDTSAPIKSIGYGSGSLSINK